VTAPIALLAVMLICSNIGEGSASDWLELYAHDDRGFRPGVAAAVFTTYTVAVTVGRLLGGPVITRLGRVATLRLCGLVTCAGLACTLHLPTAAGPYVGAALWGLGLSVVFPMAITAAGEHGRDNSAGAISAVSTMGYGAFLTGPPVIGLLAQDWSIGAALHLVMAMSWGSPPWRGWLGQQRDQEPSRRPARGAWPSPRPRADSPRDQSVTWAFRVPRSHRREHRDTDPERSPGLSRDETSGRKGNPAMSWLSATIQVTAAAGRGRLRAQSRRSGFTSPNSLPPAPESAFGVDLPSWSGARRRATFLLESRARISACSTDRPSMPPKAG